jgi:isopentenyldiphosphate isomerase
MSPSQERVQIVDRENRPTGSTTRWEMRAQGLIHRSTYILVFNSRGEIFIQKRTLRKDVYPGYWDPCTGGVVLENESYEDGAVRELAEEIGIHDLALEARFDFYFEDGGIRVWGRVFDCVSDGPFRLQAEEVESGEFMSFDEIGRRSRNEPFTPDGLRVIALYRQGSARGDLSSAQSH